MIISDIGRRITPVKSCSHPSDLLVALPYVSERKNKESKKSQNRYRYGDFKRFR